MASTHSYTITLSNNKTEKQALDFLLDQNCGFVLPDKKGKRKILDLFGLPPKYARTFDLLLVERDSILGRCAEIVSREQVTVIEVKSTQKKLPAHPAGFFFGATKNEFDLAEKLGERFKFCFVCLHPDVKRHVLLTLTDLEARIKTKRIQYQINL